MARFGVRFTRRTESFLFYKWEGEYYWRAPRPLRNIYFASTFFKITKLFEPPSNMLFVIFTRSLGTEREYISVHAVYRFAVSLSTRTLIVNRFIRKRSPPLAATSRKTRQTVVTTRPKQALVNTTALSSLNRRTRSGRKPHSGNAHPARLQFCVLSRYTRNGFAGGIRRACNIY